MLRIVGDIKEKLLEGAKSRLNRVDIQRNLFSRCELWYIHLQEFYLWRLRFFDILSFRKLLGIQLMEMNPYSPPAAVDDGLEQDATIQYRVFGGQSISFRLTSAGYRDEVRREAQLAIEQEFGADNVVSIVEHGGSFEAFTVVVWYRVRPRVAGQGLP